jgi:PelA/Pel-15E family pectate lyase
MSTHLSFLMLATICFSWLTNTSWGQINNVSLRQSATQALQRSVQFYHTKAAIRGGYNYYYSLDLQRRWGEGEATADTIFVQPPGTPTVGLAYLRAYEATQNELYLTAARDAASALIHGQLVSGGWSQTIHFGPAKRLGNYRVGTPQGKLNSSSLDDSQTQSALQFLMQLDQTLHFKQASIHETVNFGLQALLKAQFANGGFPQVWTEPVATKAVTPARYPQHDWKTEKREKNYWDYYTLNDGLAGSVADTLIAAHTIYQEERYVAALKKLGDFLLLAQMPQPQPAWCQQYNYDMEPMWARKFEPPAIAGSESLDAMRTLIKIAQHTGEKKYLEPIPVALEYLNKSLLPDGKLARFYELKSNRPLYMNSQYELTYDDNDLPKHYGWKQSVKLKAIQQSYFDAKIGNPIIVKPARSAAQLATEVQKVVSELDAEGRWISKNSGEKVTGQPNFQEVPEYLSSAVFARNVELLSEYLKAAAR